MHKSFFRWRCFRHQFAVTRWGFPAVVDTQLLVQDTLWEPCGDTSVCPPGRSWCFPSRGSCSPFPRRPCPRPSTPPPTCSLSCRATWTDRGWSCCRRSYSESRSQPPRCWQSVARPLERWLFFVFQDPAAVQVEDGRTDARPTVVPASADLSFSLRDAPSKSTVEDFILKLPFFFFLFWVRLCVCACVCLYVRWTIWTI